MALGYEGNLYILAFDHRGSFQKKFFGVTGDSRKRWPTAPRATKPGCWSTSSSGPRRRATLADGV